MLKLMIFFLLSSNWIYGDQAEDWITQANRIDEGAVTWLKEHLKERLVAENLLKNPLEPSSLPKNCRSCGSEGLSLDAPAPLYLFMSFSLKDSLWVQFSKELEKIGGIFVLRGIPQNSFKELANRIFELQEKGVTVPIQIHPKVFQEYDIQLVPSMVIADTDKYDKISGNVTLEFALERMARQGETIAAKALYQQWKAQERK